jgi:putative ABC transport system permease protein
MRHCLQQFAYQADITWWIFAAGGGFAIVTALAAVLSQVMHAAFSNPLKHLRAD